MDIEEKIRHLELIQGVINRMANNSFLIKAWCVTLVSALFALAAKDANSKFLIIAYIPVLIFWILDGYYLWQERLYRALYNQIRVQDNGQIDFSMDTNFFKNEILWLYSIFSITLCIFYITLILTILIVRFLLN